MILDLTGGDPNNLKTSIIPIQYDGGGVAIISPQGGFFHTSMNSPIVTHNGKLLKYGKDYKYVYRSKEIRRKYKISAHASIMLMHSGLSGQIELVANFIGDKYQLYRTVYLNDITSTEYLLSLFTLDTLTDIPETLPPKASIVDLEVVNRGMLSSVQLIFGIGSYLKDYELDMPPLSTGYNWPDINIGDLTPPVHENVTFNIGLGSKIHPDNMAIDRLNFTPIGSVPLGMHIIENPPIHEHIDLDMGLGSKIELDTISEARLGFMAINSVALGSKEHASQANY